MLERLDPAVHDVLARAQEQARDAGDPELAPAHLLTALSARQPALSMLSHTARSATGRPPTPGGQWLALDGGTVRVLTEAVAGADRRGRRQAGTADLLLALLADATTREWLRRRGVDADELSERTARAVEALPAAVDGNALTVRVGDGHELGTLGQAGTDARLLLLMLAKGRASAELLRSHGVDEASVRAAAEPDSAPISIPDEIAEEIASGGAVPVALGGDLPLGDLGSRGTDARLLELMLARPGRAAALLGAHGVDERSLGHFARPPL